MRIYLCLIAMMFFISSVSAELLISPNPIDIDVKMNTQTNFTLNLTNTFPFRISNLEFGNLSGFTFPDVVLDPNETQIITFGVTQSEVKTVSINSEVKFKYIVDIPNDPQTYYVNITVNGFDPNFLTIHEGDTVVWTNHDEISHTVTGGDFDFELATNLTASKTFTTVSTVDYQDLILFWGGRIEVLSKTAEQKVNNPSYNKILAVNMNVIANPTNLSINVLDKSFNMEATGTGEGMLSIENTGNEVAQKISVSSDSDWIIFDKTNFNVDKGQKSYVSFTIQPLIFSSNETNKTYNFNIKIKGLNTEEFVQNISVFIKYSNAFEQFDSNEGFLNWFNNVFCPKNQQLFICNTTVSNKQPQIIVNDPQIPINLTASQVYALLKRIQRIEDSNQRTDNKISTLTTSLEDQLPQFNRLLNDSVSQQKATEDSRATTEAVLWIAGIILIFIIGFIVSWNIYAKWKYKKYLMGDVK